MSEWKTRCASHNTISTLHNAFSLLELLAVVAILSILAALLMPVLARAREANRRAACQSNLRQWGLIFHMYAQEDANALWPPYQVLNPREPDAPLKHAALGPRFESLYSDYLPDPRIAFCPSDLDGPALASDLKRNPGLMSARPSLVGKSYLYMPWLLDKGGVTATKMEWFPSIALLRALGVWDFTGYYINAQLGAGFDAFVRQHFHVLIANPTAHALQRVLHEDIEFVSNHPDTGIPLGNGSTTTIFRLRDGIQRMAGLAGAGNGWNADPSAIWVMFDHIGFSNYVTSFNHVPGGANVLYMDGHVSFVAWQGHVTGWNSGPHMDAGMHPPVSPSTGQILGMVARLLDSQR